jgi:hypothetical protein
MQKIKLSNGLFIENIQQINDYEEKDVTNQDSRKVLNIVVLNTNYDTVYNTFSNPNNLAEIEIHGLKDVVIGTDPVTGDPITEQQYVKEGLQLGYTILNKISSNLQTNTFTVQLHRKSQIEQQLLDTQLALAELGTLIGGMV